MEKKRIVCFGDSLTWGYDPDTRTLASFVLKKVDGIIWCTVDAGGMNMKDIENAVEYYGDFKESFNLLVERPKFFDTEEGYCGKLNKNEFWIYRKHPFITNGFRTVLYGTILND